MSQREVPKTRERRTRRAIAKSENKSSIAAAKARPKFGQNESPVAPVELIIENVRCFAGRHEIPIRPLTVLVGENSSGKSTLLAALSVVCDSRFPLNPDFDKPPYSLGNFQTIATRESGKPFSARAFLIGFNDETATTARGVEASYKWHKRRTALSGLSVEGPDGKATLALSPPADTYQIEVIPAPGSKWLSNNFDGTLEFRMPARLPRSSIVPDDWGELYLAPYSLPERRREQASILNRVSTNLRLVSAVSIGPIRTKPERVYPAVAKDYSPEGRHVPSVLESMLGGATSKKNEATLRRSIKRFGLESGLFTNVGIRNLGDQRGDPFQIMITLDGRTENLIDVGFGVSQALPVVVQSILAAESDLLLLQQPEVHLHPKAQAALGSLFVDLLAQSGKRFVVETHSDYIVDRIRMEIADGKLPSEAFLILYLERNGTETTVYPITVDSLGNLLGVPLTYREFFLREAVNLLSRGE